MEKIIIFAVFAVLYPMLGVLAGAFCGKIAGWLIGDEVVLFFKGIGIIGLAPWQIGAVLGFVGGFFKSSTTVNRN